MITFELGTLIDRPMPEIFTFLSNPLNLPKWQVMIAKVEQATPGAVGVGAKYNIQAEMLGRKIDGVMEITDFEPSTKFGFVNNAGPLQVKAVITLKPVGTGAKLTANIQGNPGGVFKVAEGVLAGQIKSQMEGNFARLKSLLEAGEK